MNQQIRREYLPEHESVVESLEDTVHVAGVAEVDEADLLGLEGDDVLTDHSRGHS